MWPSAKGITAPPGPIVVNPSSGATPFGFAFSRSGVLVVSEAFGGAPDASALSSYEVNGNTGALRTISPSVGTTETAACWVAITPNGKYTYTTNTASGTVTGYAIWQGALTLLNSDGVTGDLGAGTAPTDVAISGDGQFLYAVASGTHALQGFSVAPDGSLSAAGGASGLPAGTTGLAVR